ncbi:hypothetical protein AURDEDRAFT_127483 [Auricularia subglabra TFB-10046 SS5]|nr:hypothetical protein AURDEDRAFT_127483 [Auricularia subglabra TFB-10046 SS5]
MADADAPSGSHGSTVFVSNLPYTATSVDLQTLFSDVGPVRSAFVVQDKETKISKGVGYVSFAIREDAERAMTDTYDMDGRTLRVQWPSQKNKDGDGTTEKPKKQPRASKSSSSPAKPKMNDPKAIRTIVISGLPAEVNSKVLWKKVRKQAGAEEVSEPADGVAQAVFATPSQATDAVTHLHAHVFKGALLSVALKKRLDGLLTRKGGAPSRASRLIITEADLRATFLPYGPIYSVDIPLADAPAPEDASSSTTAAPKGKGFAFVWFMSKTDAEKALAGANGKPLAAPGNAKGKVKEKAKEGRIVAVDWALSKNRWEAEKAKIEDAMDVDGSASGSSSDGDDDSVSVDGSSEDEDEEGLGVHDSGSDASDADSDDSDDGSGDDDDDEDVPKERAQLPQTDVGTTVFVRNVPYDATDDDLRTLFRAFGPLRYARVTMDHDSGRSRGTGFACFWNKEDADAVVEHARVLREEIGLGDDAAAPRKNPFAMPTSILTPDPSSSLARSLVLHGRTLDVTRAVTREQAGKLKESGERAREKQDKRNLYLMREGVIFPGTPAAATLPPAELEKRQASYNARRVLLRSNPSLYVSKTRLSVRQLPPWASERVLKRLALHAVRAFEDDVKAGTREGLAEDELHPPPEAEEDQDVRKELEKKSKGKGKGGRPTAVIQAKVVRQPERLDALSGKGRSRGYGFLQMASHAHALRVLRWANNNPAAEALMRGWFRDELADMLKKAGDKDATDEDKARRARIKAKLEELDAKKESKDGTSKGALILEFSIENVQVVRKRREKQEMQGTGAEAKTSGKKRSLMDSATTDDAPISGRDKKKRRTSSGAGEDRRKPKVETADSPAKSQPAPSEKTSKNNLGSIIGRKRKERKAKRG